jgi:predicted esterase
VTHRFIWVLSGAAAAGVVALIAWVGRSHTARAQAEPTPPIVESSWCADGLDPVEGGACFAAPSEPRHPVTLVVYLHGRYADDGVREEADRQSRLARLATERGFALLAPHGARGECSAPAYGAYFCWPSNPRNAGDGPAFVARFAPAVARARRRLGPGPNVLFGFSNGAYFAALIATRALARFDAVVVAHGGPPWSDSDESPLGAVDAGASAPPMLLVTADDDAADPEMRKLDGTLTLAGWPHALVAREGGHSLPDWDIDVALTFFRRVLREPFPLVPALPSRSQRAAQ